MFPKPNDKMSSKMLKRLGVSTADLIKTTFQQKGRIKKGEYMMFWEQLGDQSEVSSYLLQLLQQLVVCCEGKVSCGVSLDCLITSIGFLVLHVGIKPNDLRIRQFVGSWHDQEPTKDPLRDNPQARELMKLIQLKLDGNVPDMIGPLVICASTLHSLQDYKVLSSPSAFTKLCNYDALDSAYGEHTFIFYYLCNVVKTDTKYHMLVLNALVNKLLTIHQQLKLNPYVAKTTLLAFLTMIKAVLQLEAVTDRLFIKRAVTTIQQCLLWPEPYSSLAAGVLEDLQHELEFPGFCSRRIIDRLLKGIRYKRKETKQTSANEVEGDVGGKADEAAPPPNPHGWQQTVPLFIFSDSESDVSQSFLQVLDVQKHEDRNLVKSALQETIPLATEAMYVLQMLDCDVKLSAEEIDAVKSMGQEQISDLYRQLRGVEAQMVKVQYDQGKETRIKLVAPVRQAIQAAVKKGAVSGASKLELPVNLNKTSYCPTGPELNFVSLESKQQVSFIDEETAKLMCLARWAPHPLTAMQENLETVLKACGGYAKGDKDKDATSNNNKDIFLAVLGDDVTTHLFISAYVHLRETNPSVFEGLNCKIFLLGTEENHLASFVGRMDGWYHRHIGNIFRQCPFAIPFVRMDDDEISSGPASSKSSKQNKELPMGVFYRQSLEHYVKCAGSSMNLSVFVVEAYLDAPVATIQALTTTKESAPGQGTSAQSQRVNEDGEAVYDEDDAGLSSGGVLYSTEEVGGVDPDHVIPMVQRFEMGIAVSVHEFRTNNPKLGYMRFDEVVKDKAWAHKPPHCSVSFLKNKKGVAGEAKKSFVEAAAAYNALVVGKVPRKTDPFFPPDAFSPDLELWAQQLGDKKKACIERISQATLVARSSLTKFKILVDGKIYGPYARVNIKRLLGPDKQPFVIPIQTFVGPDVL